MSAEEREDVAMGRPGARGRPGRNKGQRTDEPTGPVVNNVDDNVIEDDDPEWRRAGGGPDAVGAEASLPDAADATSATDAPDVSAADR